MLEVEDGLRTWELEKPPTGGVSIRATELAVHRMEYLDYEGPVSASRGNVRQWDSGTYEVLSETPAELSLAIHGESLAGRMVLRRDAADESNWVVRCNSENTNAN